MMTLQLQAVKVDLNEYAHNDNYRASKRSPKGANLPLTYANVTNDLASRLAVMEGLLGATKGKIHAEVERHFNENGGCKECRGRHWVVTWDTLDSLSGCYAEYGRCPNPDCTPETRAKSGLHPTMTKYDHLRGVKDPVESHPAYATLIGPVKSQVDSLFAALETLRRAGEVRKGDKVVVVKGRKAPVGFVGTVFWTGTSEWGTRLGVKSVDTAGKEEVQWTYLNNVEKVYPSLGERANQERDSLYGSLSSHVFSESRRRTGVY